MTKIQIITGSTRPGRINTKAADWIYELASQRPDLDVELVDIADYQLPLFDEAMPPMMAQGNYSKEHTKNWAEKIKEADGYIFVAAEYNRGPAGALKNAIDYLNVEWKNKAAGFVGYGTVGGARAIEQLRLNLAELHVATVRDAVYFTPQNGFDNYSDIKSNDGHLYDANNMLDSLTSWAGALKSVREPAAELVAA